MSSNGQLKVNNKQTYLIRKDKNYEEESKRPAIFLMVGNIIITIDGVLGNYYSHKENPQKIVKIQFLSTISPHKRQKEGR